MLDLEAEIDAAFKALNEAREGSDPSGEALALTCLSQSLEESDRWQEAAAFHEQAVAVACGPAVRCAQAELLMRRGLAQAAGATEASYQADYALEAFWRAEELYRLAGSPDEAERARSEAARMSRLSKPHGPIHGVGDIEVVAAGFVAVTMLGPFLKAFSAKLGEQLGESTARAIGRIKLIHRRGEDRPLSEQQAAAANRLVVVVDRGCKTCHGTGTGPTGRPCGPCSLVLKAAELHPEDFVPSRVLRLTIDMAPVRTTLILPDPLNDEAKLAIIELDVTASGVRGKTLRWNESTGAWVADSE